MKQTKRNKLFAGAVATCLAGAAGIVLADDLSFWKTGSSMPVRLLATQTTSGAVSVDSRAVQKVVSAPVKFDSSAMPGLTLVVR